MPINLKDYTEGQVAVFIDAANILYSQKTLGWKVDYKRLMKYLKNSCDLIFVYFYYANVSHNSGQINFFEMLKDRGYILKTKPVKYIKTPKGSILKGNLDIEMAVDMVTLADKFDTCVLMSGDSDFEVVAKYLKRSKKKIIVISTKKHVSIELIRNCDKYINLSKLKKEVERK